MIAMILELSIGTLLWFVAGIIMFIVSAFMETLMFPGIILCIVGAICAFIYPEVYTWIWMHPLQTFFVLVIYIIIGFIFSLIKYSFITKDRLSRSHEIHVEIGHLYFVEKEQIAYWIMFWPFSILRHFIEDIILNFTSFIIDIGKYAFNLFEGSFKRIFKRLVEKELQRRK